MSTPSNPTLIITRQTNADLSSSEWLLVKPNGDDDLDLAGAGDLAIGALTNDVADGSGTQTVYVPVQVGGMIKVACGGTCTAGALAASDSAGKAVNAGDGDYAFGVALETHASGDVGSFLWAPSYLETT
ncbi:hypothetical protein CMI37_38310 [Candidatus Pacearchaeota archaeon]|nr:hypothetical protein [Candidatus Pacearchaeota archaeon]